MSIYDLLAIAIVGAVGFVLGVVTTIKVDDTHERINRK
jgi:nitrate reductase NapE component